jgi:hypothetical protein
LYPRWDGGLKGFEKIRNGDPFLWRKKKEGLERKERDPIPSSFN